MTETQLLSMFVNSGAVVALVALIIWRYPMIIRNQEEARERLAKSITESHEKAIAAFREELTRERDHRESTRDAFRESLTRIADHCESEMGRLVDEMRRRGAP